jgi:hypothetical protein
VAPPKTREQIERDYQSAVASVRDRRDLSDEGKRAHLAGIYQDARNELRAINQREDADREQQRGKLQRTLFGNPSADPSSVISYRDALDRAGQLKSAEEALDLLHRAELTQDEALARAIGHHAASRNVTSGDGWGRVLDSWAQARPGISDTLDELADLSAGDSTRAKFARKMSRSFPAPTELEGHGDDVELAKLRGMVPGESPASPERDTRVGPWDA